MSFISERKNFLIVTNVKKYQIYSQVKAAAKEHFSSVPGY